VTSSGSGSSQNRFADHYYMSVIIILSIVSIGIASVFLGAFIWSVKDGQYDDEYSPPRRMLFDDKILPPKK
jgi:cbb3-type cytochrome oxidase maturation protein